MDGREISYLLKELRINGETVFSIPNSRIEGVDDYLKPSFNMNDNVITINNVNQEELRLLTIEGKLLSLIKKEETAKSVLLPHKGIYILTGNHHFDKFIY